ncbi:response regulator [Pelagibacterium limicola]|uniref:response regulator n=1 Tax=Pelagibacterium limicola TaxID=2791022 RepID=UPI0018AF8BAA|nr:response regulator [Pelagibacterium limicola]
MYDLQEDGAPVFALVDDHVHSADLFARTLHDTGAVVQVKWLGDADRAIIALESAFDARDTSVPDLIVVDLKSHSSANENFLQQISLPAKAAGIPVAVFAAGITPEKQQRLIEAGAAAVFERHPDRNAYRREVAQISSFWVRETDTWPIRA